MRACRDPITDQYVFDKILRSLPPKFDHIVVTIEETRDTGSMELEELQHSLDSHEHRLVERRQIQEQALQARSQSHDKGKGFKKGFKKGGKKKHGQKWAREKKGKEASDQERSQE